MKKSIFSGIGRNVIVLGFVSLFTDISSEMLYPIVPLFLTTVLHAPMSVLGLIEGIAECTASLLKVISGWYSDITGRRRPLVVWGYSISAISKPLLYFAASWHVVLLSRLIDRLGKGLRTSPRDAMIALAVDPAQRGKAFGLHRAMDTIGACIGPLLAILLLSHFQLTYQQIFLWAFVPAALEVLALLFLRRSPEENKPRTRAISRKVPLSPGLVRFIAIYGIFALGNSSDVFLLMKAKEIGLSPNAVLLTYVFYNVVYALAAMPAGWLSDHVGRRALMIGGFVIFALVYLGFALASVPWMVWGLFALYGIYGAATEGVAKAWVADLSVAENRGTAMGLLQTITGILTLVASSVAGLLWTHLNPAAPFIYGAICAVSAALLFGLIEAKRT